MARFDRTSQVSPAAPSSRGTGTVYLVGAGPGDPGLLTLRGWECLQQADLVLYDGLVNPDLLRHSHAEAQRTCRSEAADGRRVPQGEINERLIAAAKAGHTVVRLKGGDPFIFGRGSEEAAALAAAGVPFEVVPGITAATAAAVYSGLSLTHREFSSAVAFITGHEDPQKATSPLNYAALAAFPGTLVFYMGLDRLERISRALIDQGKPTDTPALVISRATTPFQQTVTSTIQDIAQEVQTAGLHAPSLLIIGEVVQLREKAAWFEQRKLFGQVIGITRPEDQSDDAMALAYRQGAQPVLLPTIEISPPESWSAVDDVLTRLAEFDWLVFTSVNGVRGLLGRLWETGGDLRRVGKSHLAAIGPSTAESLHHFGLRADLMPATFRAEALAEAMHSLVAGKRILWARASRGRDVLSTELRDAGAWVEEVVVYRNQDVEELPAATRRQLDAGELDWIGLSSPSIVRNLSRLLSPAARRHLGTRTKLASISPVTTAAALQAGLPISAEAKTYTWPGIFEAICSHGEDARGREGNS